jgi:microcystin-dependent protein
MAILSKGNTFADGDQVTSTSLNNLVDNATFVAGSGGTTDDATLEVAAGQLKVKIIQTGNIADSAVTTAKIGDGQVTAVKLAADAVIPAGAIMPFAMNSNPTGWLACNGNDVSRSTYAALFSAISTTYGSGDGSTTFTLPDLRGYFVRGAGTNADGTASGAFGENQVDEFKSHVHATLMGQGNGVSSGCYSGGAQTAFSNDCGTRNTTSNGGDETRPRNIAMLYCIKT